MIDCSAAAQGVPETDLQRALRESMEEANREPNTESPRQEGFPVGLFNPGDQCAMNTILQTYFMLRPLRTIVLGWQLDQLDSFVDNVVKDTGKKKTVQFMRKLQNVFREMAKSQFAVVNAEPLVQTWGSFFSDQKEYSQSDINDINNRFLDLLCAGQDLILQLNRLQGRNCHDQKNPVKELFLGEQVQFSPSQPEHQEKQEFKSLIVAPCGTLEDALANQFKSKVVVDGRKQSEEQTSWISKAPKVLLIQEDRVLFDRGTLHKNNAQMEFPQDLWMDQFMLENRTAATETKEPAKGKQATKLMQATQDAQLSLFQEQQSQFTQPQSDFPLDRIEPLSQALTTLHGNARISARELKEEEKHASKAIHAAEFLRGYMTTWRQEQPMFAQYPFSFEQQFCAELGTLHHRAQWRVNELREKHQKTTQAIAAYQTILAYLKKQQQTKPSPKTQPLCFKRTLETVNDLTLVERAAQREEEKQKAIQPIPTKCHKYVLYSVCVHGGTVNSGHYFAHVKDFATGNWFKMSDGKVSLSSVEDAMKDGEGREKQQQNASLLVYVSEDMVDTFTHTDEQDMEERDGIASEKSKKPQEKEAEEITGKTTIDPLKQQKEQEQKTEGEHKQEERGPPGDEPKKEEKLTEGDEGSKQMKNKNWERKTEESTECVIRGQGKASGGQNERKPDETKNDVVQESQKSDAHKSEIDETKTVVVDVQEGANDQSETTNAPKSDDALGQKTSTYSESETIIDDTHTVVPKEQKVDAQSTTAEDTMSDSVQESQKNDTLKSEAEDTKTAVLQGQEGANDQSATTKGTSDDVQESNASVCGVSETKINDTNIDALQEQEGAESQSEMTTNASKSDDALGRKASACSGSETTIDDTHTVVPKEQKVDAQSATAEDTTSDGAQESQTSDTLKSETDETNTVAVQGQEDANDQSETTNGTTNDGARESQKNDALESETIIDDTHTVVTQEQEVSDQSAIAKGTTSDGAQESKGSADCKSDTRGTNIVVGQEQKEAKSQIETTSETKSDETPKEPQSVIKADNTTKEKQHEEPPDGEKSEPETGPKIQTPLPTTPQKTEEDDKKQDEKVEKTEDYSCDGDDVKPPDESSAQGESQKEAKKEEDMKCTDSEETMTLVRAITYLEGLKETRADLKCFCETVICELKKYDDEQKERKQDEDEGLLQDFIQDKRMCSLEDFLSQFTSKEYARFQKLLVTRILKSVFNRTFYKNPSSELDPTMVELMKCDKGVEEEAQKLLNRTVAVANEIKKFMKLSLGSDSNKVWIQLKQAYLMNKSLPKECDFTYQLSVMGHLFFIRRQRMVTQDVANLLVSVFDANEGCIRNSLRSSSTPGLSNSHHNNHFICSLDSFFKTNRRGKESIHGCQEN